MATFVKISKDQFSEWADGQFGFNNWEYKKPDFGIELVLVAAANIPQFEYHIYTTLTEEAGETRDSGTDAIRCVLLDTECNKPAGHTKKVLRVIGKTTVWERLEQRLQSLNEIMEDLEFCNKCGSHMVERENRKTGHKFMGCSAYPNCGKEKREYPLITKKEEEDIILQDKNLSEYEEPCDSENFAGTKNPNCNLVSEAELVSTSDYPHVQFPFPSFNRMQSTIMKHGYWNQDINLVLGTTTSSGKTVAAEMFMAETLKQGDTVVYVSPLKSLTQEKYDEWSERYSDYSICILTGDYTLTDKRTKELNDADIVCLTSEMIDSRTRNHQSEKSDWMFDVKLVIVDETHIISTNRGHAVEAGLMRFAKLVPAARLLCLSATMPNVTDFKQWLTALNNKETAVINSDWRPVHLEWHYVKHQTQGSYYECQASKQNLAMQLIESKPNEKFLVFVHDKNTGRQLTSKIQSSGIETYFHNADLALNDRLEIETQFADKKTGIRVMVSTSTLAWGRNLPAKNVIITGVHRGLNDVDELDIIQMAGRAGRAGVDKEGDVFLICDNPHFWEHTVNNPRRVTSTLLDEGILGFHILAEVKNNQIWNHSTLMKWFERTLATLQMEVQSDLINKVIASLQQMGMLVIDNDKYKITRLGRVSATLYYLPDDIYHWSMNFSKISENNLWDSDLAVSYVLGTTPSLDLGYVPRAMDDDVAEYTAHVNRIWPGDAHYVKRSVIATQLYDLLTQGKSSAYVRTAQYDVERISQALTWIDGIRHWNNRNFWKALPIRIKYGVGKELVDLCMLPGVGSVRAKKLYAENIRSLNDVMKAEHVRLKRVLGEAGAAKVKTAAKKMLGEVA